MTTTPELLVGERRTIGVALRDVETTDSLSMLRGRAVPYEEPTDIGWFIETMAAGSLGKSARESAAALPLMLFHGEDGYQFPAGSINRWDEQATGLYGEWNIADDPEAQRAAKLAKDGHLGFMSIRFAPIRDKWTPAEEFNPALGPDHKDKVRRLEARLLETSLVTTPAYNGATVEWVRTAAKPKAGRSVHPSLDEWRRVFDALKADR